MIINYLFLLLSTLVLCKASTVPVLLWSNMKIGEDILKSSVQPVPYSHFEQLFFNSFPSKNLIIILQDELSIEDFSSHESSFKYINEQFNKHNSIYLPNVENPYFLINDLPDYGFKVKTVDGIEGKELKMKSDSANAIIINLPSTTHSSSRKYPLQKSDEIIEKVFANLGNIKDFTVMFTALRPVQSIDNAMRGTVGHSIKKRNAKLPQKHFKTQCAILHVGKDFLYIKDSIKYTLPVHKLTDAAVSECGTNVSTIQINYGGIDQLGEVTVKFTFNMKYGRKWIIHSAEVKSSLSTTPEILLTPRWVTVMKANESLACAAPITFIGTKLDMGRATEALKVKAIQVQAFTKGATKFSRSVDCIGFFSIAIWAGLLVSFLLVGILSWGFHMIVNLKTMDHFDDPKAKPLVQSTSE